VAVSDIKEVLTGKDCPNVKDKSKKVIYISWCFLTTGGMFIAIQVELPLPSDMKSSVSFFTQLTALVV